MGGRATLLGGLETGGTRTRVAVATRVRGGARLAPGPRVARLSIGERDEFPTGAPAQAVERAAAFFERLGIAALGVAAFGPIDVEPGSPSYGMLLETPKPAWSGFSLRGALENRLRVPVRVDTDVNAAALAEQDAARATGAAAGTLVYVTVGTGIGVGVALDGRAHHGTLHPEAGHLPVRRAPGDDFVGLCPFHRDCLEGLASGPALEARARADSAALPPDHRAWAFEAEYLAQLVVAIAGFLAPHQIVLGGGVMKAPGLLERVRARAVALSSGYTPLLLDAARAERLVIAPRLGADSGLCGALLLAGAAAP